MITSRGKLSLESTQYKILLPVLLCLALAILTVITFWPLKDCGFINLDDNVYVYENANVQSGLNWNSIRQTFSFELREGIGHWHPVTWLSLMLDYQIFGLNPQGFHLINLLFHVMNTILLFLILCRMTKKLWPSAFVAALFAIHPLHVESVAWITERKDVLSTFFWMLAMGAYSYYVEHPGFRRYFFVLLFFILGLMVKSMLITLPFVLLLLDYWPLQRFQGKKQDHKIQNEVFKFETSDKQKKKSKNKQETLEIKKPADPGYKRSLIYPLFWEKVPLFVLIILSSIITYIAAQSARAVLSDMFPLGVRIMNAFISYIAYIGKMIWPSNLAVFYPYQKFLVPWQVLGSVLLLITITLLVIWRAKRFPYLATGWLWYLGTLVPVIGIVQAGGQAMADRYTYIPMIGLFIIVAWGVQDLFKKKNFQKEIFLSSSVLSILCLSIITWTQVGYWKNSIELWNHTLKVTDYNWFAYNNRGVAYIGLRNYKQAIEDFNRAIAIKPGYAEAYNNRGNAYNSLGNYKQAIEDYNRAIKIKPGYAIAYNDRGGAYGNLGQYQQAIEDFNDAIRLKLNDGRVYNNRGVAYAKLGQYQQAIKDYNEAIRLKPNYTDAYNNRKNAYAKFGQQPWAIEDYNEVIRLKPNYADAYNDRGIAYGNLGQYQRAIKDYSEAIRLKLDYADAYFNRGVAYANLGQYQRAIEDYNDAIRLKPDHVEAYGNRGSVYDKLSQYKQAIEDYNEAIRLKPDYADAYSNRGIVYDKLSQYQRAIEDYNQAIRLDPNHAEAYSNRGITYDKLGEYQRAIKDCTEAIRLKHDDAISYNIRGYAYLLQGNKELACRDAQKACTLGKCKLLEMAKGKGDCH
jgi:tetratricopeptide (TPR) repeat protein